MRVVSLVASSFLLGHLLLELPHVEAITGLQQIGPSNLTFPIDFTPLNKNVIFSGQGSDGVDVWTTDGTTSGTTVLMSNPLGVNGSYPVGFTVLNGKIYFRGQSAKNGTELFVTDGTSSGTKMVTDIVPGPNSSDIICLTTYKNSLYFIAYPSDSPNATQKLFVSDGTSSGTKQISHMTAGSCPYNLTGVGLILSQISGNSSGLYVTNGTAEPSVVKTFDGQITYFSPEVSGKRLFYVQFGNDTAEIWVTDGSASGTQLFSGGPNATLYAFGPTLLGSKLPLSTGTDLYLTAGDPTDVKLITTVFPNNPDRYIFFLPVESLFLVADPHDDQFLQLWSTDGTRVGTRGVISFANKTRQQPSMAVSTLELSTGEVIVFEDNIEDGSIYITDKTQQGTALINTFTKTGFRSPVFNAAELNSTTIVFRNFDHKLWALDFNIPFTSPPSPASGNTPGGGVIFQPTAQNEGNPPSPSNSTSSAPISIVPAASFLSVAIGALFMSVF